MRDMSMLLIMTKCEMGVHGRSTPFKKFEYYSESSHDYKLGDIQYH